MALYLPKTGGPRFAVLLLLLLVLTTACVLASWPIARAGYEAFSLQQAELLPLEAQAYIEPGVPTSPHHELLPEPLARAHDESPQATYHLWQESITAYSDEEAPALLHGRQDVQDHAATIRYYVPQELELLVAAAIAHQASDAKDRPFGTDTVEVLWRELVDEDASVGIAQIREDEIAEWIPQLRGEDPLAPEVAIRVMNAKLMAADLYMTKRYGQVSPTDRAMLLALVQNLTSHRAMAATIDFFFQEAGGDWDVMLAGDLALRYDWQEQLRLVLVHVDWLIAQGWTPLTGMDRQNWRQIAFSQPLP